MQLLEDQPPALQHQSQRVDSSALAGLPSRGNPDSTPFRRPSDVPLTVSGALGDRLEQASSASNIPRGNVSSSILLDTSL